MSAADAGNNAPRPDFPRAELLVPVLWEIVARWHDHSGEIADWDEAVAAFPPRHEAWAGLAERIQLINTFQWHEEDRSRAHGAGDRILAAVKRSIDASNSRRVKSVEIFDAHIDRSLADVGLANPDAPLHSESAGSIVDRLSVLLLKMWHTEEGMSEAQDRDAREGLAGRLNGLREQVEDLAGCLDRLFDDVAAGRTRIKLYRQVKVYRDPETGRYLSDLD